MARSIGCSAERREGCKSLADGDGVNAVVVLRGVPRFADTENFGFQDAHRIPHFVAARRIRPAHDLAAGRVVTAWRAVGFEAVTIAGSAGGALREGDIDAEIVPLNGTAAGFGEADDLTTALIQAPRNAGRFSDAVTALRVGAVVKRLCEPGRADHQRGNQHDQKLATAW